MIEDEFGLFDFVKLIDDFEGFDLDDEFIFLEKGMQGTVLDLGQEPGTLIVRFHTGQSLKIWDYNSVELDAESVQLVSKIGSRFSEPFELTLQETI